MCCVNAISMSAALPVDFIQNKRIKEMILNEVPIQAFILTKEYSPRDSQDDKFFPEHFKIIQNFIISIRK